MPPSSKPRAAAAKKKAKPKAPLDPEKAIRRRVGQIMAQKSRGPRFLVELTSSVYNSTKQPIPEIETVISRLGEEGALIIRERTFVDPHLEGVDLRIVAPVDLTLEDGALESAEAQVESLWQHWLAQWLSKHKCEAVGL